MRSQSALSAIGTHLRSSPRKGQGMGDRKPSSTFLPPFLLGLFFLPLRLMASGAELSVALMEAIGPDSSGPDLGVSGWQ